MSKRPTVRDVAERAGVSVATVDRVMNARCPVRSATAERVLRAADELDYHARTLLRRRIEETAPKVTLGFLLQKSKKRFYQQLAVDLNAQTQSEARIRGTPLVAFVEDLSPDAIVAQMRALGDKADALAVVAVDHPKVAAEVEALRERGVPTFALLSDLTAPARAGHIGVDGRKAGRTAAWAVARLARMPGNVGILVGSHRYLGHEDREIGFRSYFREHAPGFRVLEPVVYLDDAVLAYDAAHELLKRHPEIVGFYHCGGGVEGALRAVREEGFAQRIAFVCHELTPSSREGLIDGAVDVVIASPTQRIATEAVDAMVAALRGEVTAARQILVPFEIYVSENI
ncbi:LacI family DNA-binding transcriptional regulator [Pelagibius sp.]|uniref:LacI family DNA-binding transcriptional regulator n=1 Tax=Pelagibius sp. TaxID=1931238 RepID=UPI00261953C9|nr:LacI family DNA-binding transcriptional regulator [Pelagibius sp.]